jgi:hypothetical protein
MVGWSSEIPGSELKLAGWMQEKLCINVNNLKKVV